MGRLVKTQYLRYSDRPGCIGFLNPLILEEAGTGGRNSPAQRGMVLSKRVPMVETQFS